MKIDNYLHFKIDSYLHFKVFSHKFFEHVLRIIFWNLHIPFQETAMFHNKIQFFWQKNMHRIMWKSLFKVSTEIVYEFQIINIIKKSEIGQKLHSSNFTLLKNVMQIFKAILKSYNFLHCRSNFLLLFYTINPNNLFPTLHMTDLFACRLLIYCCVYWRSVKKQFYI